jgi:hypothetical protein
MLFSQVPRELAQRVDIRGKLEVALWSRLHVHRSEDVYFIRRRRLDDLGNGLPRADRSYLLFIQSSELAEKLIRLVRGVCLDQSRQKASFRAWVYGGGEVLLDS